jgi:hypothetical protein
MNFNRTYIQSQNGKILLKILDGKTKRGNIWKNNLKIYEL